MTECGTLQQYLQDSRELQEIGEWRLLGSQGAVHNLHPANRSSVHFVKQARRKAAAKIERRLCARH
jgi:hypothetical protein